MRTIRINNNNTCTIENENDIAFLWSLDRELSFAVQGAEHTRAFKGYVDKEGNHHRWDGIHHLLNQDLSFPIGLLTRVKDFYKSTGRTFHVIDVRPTKESNSSIDIISTLKKSGKEPYSYQLDAANATKNEDHGILRVATGGGKCSSVDSIHITDKGILDYEELLEEIKLNPQELIPYNVKISTPLTKNNIDYTSCIYRDGYGKSFHIKTSYGFEIKATQEHKIKVINSDGNIEWKKIGEIKYNDISVISPNTNLFGNNDLLSENDAYWLGLLIGNGGLSRKNYIGFTNMDSHIIDFVEKYAKNIKGYHNYQHNNSKITREIRIYNTEYRKKLFDLGFDYSLLINKTIPKIIRQSPKNVVAAFVRGLYETDGWVDKKPAICIGLSSKRLIDQLHIILLNFGIVASRRIKKTKHQDFHILTIYRDYIPKFIEEIGLDPKGHKFIKLNKVLQEMKDVSYNSNTDIIPHQESKLRRLKDIIKKTNKGSIDNFFIDSTIKANVFRSWTDIKAWRKPSRNSLKELISLVRNKFTGEDTLSNEAKTIVSNIEYLCSNEFYYDRVKFIHKTYSDNYDFVVPNTHSFVSQGFINHNTLISALVTANFGKKTILYVIGKDLLYQTHKFFSSVFNDKIGIVGDGVCDIQDINIVSVWTVGQALGLKKTEILTEAEEETSVDPQKYQDIRQMLFGAKVHIFDECHLAACNTIQEIAKNINPEHIYGMSASPWRDDNADLLIECVLGKKIVDISASYLIDNGFLVKPIIKFLKVPPLADKSKKSYQTIYKNYITDNPIRNGMVIKATERLVEQGYQTLVLYNNVVHGNTLYQELSKKIPCALLSGKDSSEVREKVKYQLENHEINCIIASKIFDIGVDLPSLSGLVIAGGGKSSVRALQRIGRVIRKYPNKKQAAVVDFYDDVHFLKDHSKERIRIYKTEPAFEIHLPKNELTK